MMEPSVLSSASSSYQAQQAQLLEEVRKNSSNCIAVKSALCSILDKIVPPVDTKTVVLPDDNDDALSSCSDSSGTSTLSLDTVINNFNQSLDSISQISSDSEEEDNINDDIPGLQHFLDLLSEGKLEISKEVFTDLSNLKSKIDEICEISDNMRGRIAALEYKIVV